MTKDKFVVLDFVVQRTGNLPKVNGKAIKVSSKELAERASKRIIDLLTKSLSSKRGRVTSETIVTGERANRARQGHPYLTSVIIKQATIKDVMQVEDVLRAEADDNTAIALKMRDSTTKKYLTMEAVEFILSGPKGGEWAPFVDWYKGAKALGLPL